MNNKAVALFSGGLDSILAIKIMLEQGIEIMALHFSSAFCDSKSKSGQKYLVKSTDYLKVPVKIMDITEEFMDIIKNPRYGRGSNMNPCIDCRIFTFKKAKAYMEDIGASFIVTGEVVGERPMSQTKRAISLIEKKSGLDGLIVRPLSAKMLKPSLPEVSGVVMREKLFDIQGRRRDIQIALAEKFGIKEYPNPAGGCLLTDKRFSDKLKDLLSRGRYNDPEDIEILKTGRHFKISDHARLIVGRDEKENNALIGFARPGDHVFDVIDIPSPIALARGSINEEDICLAASIVARYSDASTNKIEVSYKIIPLDEIANLIVKPATETTIKSIRI
jgi:tRNA-uridine 2-sulfurtransferase